MSQIQKVVELKVLVTVTYDDKLDDVPVDDVMKILKRKGEINAKLNDMQYEVERALLYMKKRNRMRFSLGSIKNLAVKTRDVRVIRDI